MKLGGLTYHRQNNSGALKLGNLLDVTRQALRREDNGNYLHLIKNMEVWVIPLRLLLLSILTLTTNTAMEQASARVRKALRAWRRYKHG